MLWVNLKQNKEWELLYWIVNTLRIKAILISVWYLYSNREVLCESYNQLLTLKHFFIYTSILLKKKSHLRDTQTGYLCWLGSMLLSRATSQSFKPCSGCQQADFHSVTQSITLATFPLAACWVWTVGRTSWRSEDRKKGALGCLSPTMFPHLWKRQHWAI